MSSTTINLLFQEQFEQNKDKIIYDDDQMEDNYEGDDEETSFEDEEDRCVSNYKFPSRKKTSRSAEVQKEDKKQHKFLKEQERRSRQPGQRLGKTEKKRLARLEFVLKKEEQGENEEQITEYGNKNKKTVSYTSRNKRKISFRSRPEELNFEQEGDYYVLKLKNPQSIK